MDRRKKGSGQITKVPGRKSPWRAAIVDSSGKQKTRFFKTEKEAKAFLREINADENRLKALLETGVTFGAFAEVFLGEKAKENMKPTAYKTLERNKKTGERVIVLNKQAVADLQMLRKQYEEQVAEIDHRMKEELQKAEHDLSGSDLKSAKRQIKEKYEVIHREHKYICGASTFPFGSGVESSTNQTHRKICKKDRSVP